MGLLTRLLFPGLAAITVILVMIRCSATAHCPATWKHFQRDCYKFIPESKALFDYIKYCRKFGAKVLEIKSAAENDFITKYLKTFGDNADYVWLGIVSWSGNWKYMSDEKKITYTHWATGQPDSGDEYCIIFGTDGAWYDVLCNQYPRYGICTRCCVPPYPRLILGYWSHPLFLISLL